MSNRRTRPIKPWTTVLLANAALVAAGVSVAAESRPTLPTGPGGMKAPYEEILASLRESPYQTVRESNAPARFTLAELRKGQLAWRDALRSLYVEFRREYETIATTPSDRSQNKGDRPGKLLPPLEYVYAFKGDKCYTRYAPYQKDKRDQVVYVSAYDGHQMRRYEPHRAVGFVDPARLIDFEANAVWYCDFISLPVGKQAELQRQSAWYIPTALSMDSVYQVRPRLEEVEGAPCHVVSNGWDTFWIDARHGFCLRRRVWFRKMDMDDPGCVMYVYMPTHFEEIDKGIWLPRLCFRMDYATQEDPEEWWGTLKGVLKVTVSELRANDVPDSLFRLEFPPGTRVHDLIAKKVYIVPGGKELLDRALQEALPIVDGKVQPRRRRSLESLTRVLALSAVILVVAWLGVFWAKRRSRR